MIGPNALRYVHDFLGLLSGSGLDTGAKMELLGLVNGFAISYGGVQAALVKERARTGVTEQEQAAAQVAGLVAAAAAAATRTWPRRWPGRRRPPGTQTRSSTAVCCGSLTPRLGRATEMADLDHRGNGTGPPARELTPQEGS